MLNFDPEWILHQDAWLLAVSKPAEVSLLADRGGDACLWDALKGFCASQGVNPPHLVHRLDKGTSGVLLVALAPECQKSLTRQFAQRETGKTYLAVVAGIPQSEAGRIDLPLRPGRKSRFRVAGPREAIECTADGLWRLRPGTPTDPEGHPSQTDYRVLVVNELRGRALLEPHPETGRTHQLRVHLSWIGLPIVGDRLYGKPDSDAQRADRLMLHCRAMEFSAEWLPGSPRQRIEAPVPGEFEEALGMPLGA